MQTLSHGYKKPANPDTGDVWMPAMETNIQLVNDHTHNGIDAAQLAVIVQSILSAAWVAAPIGGGHYRQLVTMTSPLQYDSTTMEFRLSSGELIFPSVERVSANTYYVYTLDNSLTYSVLYR